MSEVTLPASEWCCRSPPPDARRPRASPLPVRCSGRGGLPVLMPTWNSQALTTCSQVVKANRQMSAAQGLPTASDAAVAAAACQSGAWTSTLIGELSSDLDMDVVVCQQPV